MGIHWGTGVGQLSMVEGSKHSFTPVRWAWPRPHGRPFFASAAVNSSAARPMADAPDAPPSQRPFSRLEKTRRGRRNFRDVIARCRRTRRTTRTDTRLFPSLCLPSRPTSKSDSSMRMRPLQTAAGRSLRRFRITGKAIAVTVGYSDIDVDGLIIDETSDMH